MIRFLFSVIFAACGSSLIYFFIYRKWDKIAAKSRKAKPIKRPETSKVWTTIYFGDRGSGKTLHQSKEMMNILRYLEALYRKFPSLHPAIVFTNQHIAKKVSDRYGKYIYHWTECEDFHYCPRENCWRGKQQHELHGCYLIFDDVSVILDPRNWPMTPDWLKDYFTLGRHHGLHILASLVHPENVDIAFRRTIDFGYKFTKLWGNPDPDETQPPIKFIFGIYRRRRIEASMLWRQGNLPEQTIRLMLLEKEEREKALKEAGKENMIVDDDSWRGSYHLFNRTGEFLGLFGENRLFRPIASTEIYDTLQNVKRFEPQGYLCSEYRCIDPNHWHIWDHPEATPEEIKEMKKKPEFCDYIKRQYDLV